MPDTAAWMSGEPPEPEPAVDWRKVEILLEGLTRCPPRDFATFFEMAEDDGPERIAAVDMAVNIINIQLETYPRDSPQWRDAAARADELHRLTMGDD